MEDLGLWRWRREGREERGGRRGKGGAIRERQEDHCKTHILTAGDLCDGGRLRDGLIDSLDEHPVACGDPADLDGIPRLAHPQPPNLMDRSDEFEELHGDKLPEGIWYSWEVWPTYLSNPGVLLIVQSVTLSKDPYLLPCVHCVYACKYICYVVHYAHIPTSCYIILHYVYMYVHYVTCV